MVIMSNLSTVGSEPRWLRPDHSDNYSQGGSEERPRGGEEVGVLSEEREVAERLTEFEEVRGRWSNTLSLLAGPHCDSDSI